MKIKIIAIGSMDKEFKTIAEKYANRINSYAQIQISEIREVNDKNIIAKVKKESILIDSLLPKKSNVYLCSLEGKEYNSEEFSKLLKDVESVTFVIGGSNGVEESKFENKIKFSNLTFPHQLFRILLLEQIFRGLNIISNGKYHK